MAAMDPVDRTILTNLTPRIRLAFVLFLLVMLVLSMFGFSPQALQKESGFKVLSPDETAIFYQFASQDLTTRNTGTK